MTNIQNPTKAELKSALETADLPVGRDIEARLGRDPGGNALSASLYESSEEEE